jgi:hypothetical protein
MAGPKSRNVAVQVTAEEMRGPAAIPQLARQVAGLEKPQAVELSLTPAQVQGLVDWLGSVDCHALTYGDLPAAVALLLDLSSPAAEQCTGRPSMRVVA